MKCSLPLLFLSLIVTLTAEAQTRLTEDRGRELVKWSPASGRTAELCFLPKHFPKIQYRIEPNKNGEMVNKDAETEAELCSFNFHVASGKNAVAVCPKLTSTNPALEVFEIPNGSDKYQVEVSQCKKHDAKKLAKYKMSTSCSHTPSILGYYHVSRILGNVAHVPASVLRTVDPEYHLQQARLGAARTKQGQLINTNWNVVVAGLSGRGSSLFNNLVLTTTGQSFGALSDNPRGEIFYQEMFHQGNDRVIAFKDKNPYYRLLSQSSPISRHVGKDWNADNVQKVVAVKDVSDMIVLDYLFNQQDRFGNIAALEYIYYPSGDASMPVRKVLAKKAPEDILKRNDIVKIKEMLLRDNDCGGYHKTNWAKKKGLLDGVRHMHPLTYRRLLWLQTVFEQPESQEFFLKELVFTNHDLNMLRTNLNELVSTLKSRCQRGELFLDLDIQTHFGEGYKQNLQECSL